MSSLDRSRVLGLVTGALALVLIAGCAQGSPMPGMASRAKEPSRIDPRLEELARVSPAVDERALLVVHPRAACSGSARTVFVDANGRFYGSIAAGEAALLRLPLKTRKLFAFSSVEVTANPGAWSAVDEIDVPSAPSGLLVTPWGSARQCGSGHYASASVATKSDLEDAIADAEIQWLEPRPAEGQAWLDAHRERVGELLGRQRPDAPAVLTRLRVR